MEIRTSVESEKSEIIMVHETAFGKEEGPEVGRLVNGLFEDQTAEPSFSLVAVVKGVIMGHILFTQVSVTGCSESIQAQILAPLAVLPEAQNKGVGEKLINEGLAELKKSGINLVFVLGHPGYYPRCGFSPAGILGYEAPYHIPEKNSDAWMVQELSPGIIKSCNGKIQCSDALNKPEHWRE